ncbi:MULTISPECIES: ABC transporter permease [Rhizobium]|uniref:ABC transporter permease n=1 Tax=Rhizobium tropici TaxID=398 RepID=A0A6P1C4W8_RHITR|nr:MULTISPECIES: ABC transporter permease [Rhizobium]AGB74629.1 putative oligopeptide ABC transporter, permease protein [Rhizobium tropici CIAT 899]MBB4242633.1 peptide/nickel transport system permease protein [Rhizobium tropici]MBB5594462.1 peptide/nickel transport system permease protein [Rhizobium tropici]MBB6492958.1 peptide/nickel transport system permease protein [Rhizobium tropici]NEV10623.1 ABC transporter permease [Rhizobium tropici]
MSFSFRSVFSQKKALVGFIIVAALCLMAIFAPIIAPGEPGARVGRSHQPPSVEHVFGTTKMGRDVYKQFVWGARSSLSVGFATGIVITVLGTAIGLIAGYTGGKTDAALDLATNAVLVIPNMPLLILLASFAGTVGPMTIMTIIALTSWPWGARMTRSQTMALRNRDFVTAAKMIGEPAWRIIFVEILPNLTPLIGINLVGSIIYAIVAQTTLEYLGFGDPLKVTWGTMLYNAQNASAIMVGAWWDIGIPAIGIALTGLGLALINFTFDEIANPQLRSGPALTRWFRLTRARNRMMRAEQ